MRCSIALVAVAAAVASIGAAAQQRALPVESLRSGIEFAGADVRAMQADDLANPGFLWVERGQRLWQGAVNGKSCATCHGDAASMRGVAAHYPKYDRAAGAVLDLESRINACRTANEGAAPLERESEDLLALTAYVASQSRGVPVAVSVDGPARASFERGRALYTARHGQMNLSCAQCHDRNWGKQLYAEKLSQGHGNAFPAYRLEWQSLGSLQRRIRACFFGIRAEMPRLGAPELTDLELYLSWREQGLPIEAPGVRR